MWLRLAFRQSLKISSTWDTKNFMIFCIFYPKDYLGYFVLGQFRFAHHSKLFVKARHQMKVLLGFENFQIVAHELLGCQFLEKYRIFHFDQLMHQKKNSGYFGIAEYAISRHISRCTFRIYIYNFKWLQALSNKLCGFENQKKCDIFAIFVFLPFSTPLEKQ